ncbi:MULTISPECIES: hypothetical protein [Pseudomonas]|nr:MULTISPECIES: hypothetical protein [Pseudomonas]QFZ61323.1 hypothetical protein FVF66_10175 [Pseudomonas aeruginosa PA99]EIU1416143.1 hypothetical protein [Pseudomonas aeruginosa]EKU3791083.1 hypothetical protein [Pseudomonas aeruginosa]EKV3151388.1 hypothetical protein [Pseudomonas aeruginosa]EKV9030965.1 hypothetical protein [Pseudomonas aeruginosa]
MNYLDAVTAGLKKADDADFAKQEVTSAFDEINGELRSFPQGVIFLKRVVPEIPSTKILEAMSSSVLAATFPFMPTPATAPSSVRDKYLPEKRLQLILAENGKEFKASVADWEQSSDGYPCSIKFEGKSISCFNKEELTTSIKELLSSVTFGETLKSLMRKASLS